MRVVEAFSGIGSQSKALRNIGVIHEVVATIEWEMGAIYGYDIIHNGAQDLSEYDNLTKIDLINGLSNHSLSINGKDPVTYSQLTKYPLEALKRIDFAINRSNNLVSIVDVTAQDLPEDIDLFTYSFPCQDLSLSGSWHGNIQGIDRDANNRSGMLWEVERILIESIEAGIELPKYLLMENVTNIMSPRHIDNFMEWQDFLTESGYYNHVYKLNSENFGVPQRRSRAFMISIWVGDNPENTNYEKRQELQNYFDLHNLENNVNEDDINLEDFLRLDYHNIEIYQEALTVIPNDTVSRRKIRQENDLLYNGHRVQNFVRTITTKQDRHPNSGVIDLAHHDIFDFENKSQFRYLTPRECFLLMGFENEDFERLIDNNFQYNRGRKFLGIDKLNKLAGNSIVVNVLEEIFTQIIDIDNDLFNARMNATFIEED